MSSAPPKAGPKQPQDPANAGAGTSHGDTAGQRASVITIATRMVAEARALFGSEVALASAEIRFNFGRLALAFAIILAGGLVLGISGIALLAALMAALLPYLGPVVSALVTAAAALVAGLALVAAGIRRMHTGPLAPHRTLANLRSTVESLKTTDRQETK